MSVFGLLLLFFLGYFVIWPLVKVLLRINAARRQFRDMMNGGSAAAGFGERREEERPRKGGWSRAPRQRRKKIPDGTGEYVAFEEVTVSSTTTESADGHTRADYTVEQQIVDVEWEDVK